MNQLKKLAALKELIDSEMSRLMKEKSAIVRAARAKSDGDKLRKIRADLDLKNA